MTTHTTTASLTSMTIMTWVIIGPGWAKPSWKRYMGKGSFAAKAFAICMKSHCEIIGKAIQLCPPLAKVESTVESRFSPFFHFHPWMTSTFHRFLAFIRGWRVFFTVYSFSSMDDEQFSMKIINLLSYLSIFSWKLSIYYRIWVVFPENIQFTIVFEHLFLKTCNLLSYLNIFFWKHIIYYRIWVTFFENQRFTPVSG